MILRNRHNEPKDLLERYIIDGKGCWLVQGGLTSNGYARIRINKVARLAHRVAYELFYGPIPEKMQVNHHCDVRHCINPKHLFLGTQSDNMRDCKSKGRLIAWGRNDKPGA